MDSTVSWGSDKADLGCRCLSHNDDEVEVAEWLLYANETDWAVPAPPSSQGEPSQPPFSAYSTPASFWAQFLFTCWVALFCVGDPEYIRPELPQPIKRLFPIKKIPLYNQLLHRDHEVRVNGTRMMYDESETYHLVDDYEYVIYARPGTDQKEWHIPLTLDISDQKLDTHLPGLLRVYRMPWNEFSNFSRVCYERKLPGVRVRQPTDRFDNVTVFRQGFITLEPRLNKEEYWMLLGTDLDLIKAIAMQTSAWPRPKPIRIIQHVFWTVFCKLFYVAPWPTHVLWTGFLSLVFFYYATCLLFKVVYAINSRVS